VLAELFFPHCVVLLPRQPAEHDYLFNTQEHSPSDSKGAPVFVPLQPLPRSGLYMGNYSGCQDLLASLIERGIAVRMQKKVWTQEHALDFQVTSFFAAFFAFFLLSATLCLIFERRAVVPRLLVSVQQ
jgi:hypothetical protein